MTQLYKIKILGIKFKNFKKYILLKSIIIDEKMNSNEL
jgi:hypothetical protein